MANVCPSSASVDQIGPSSVVLVLLGLERCWANLARFCSTLAKLGPNWSETLAMLGSHRASYGQRLSSCGSIGELRWNSGPIWLALVEKWRHWSNLGFMQLERGKRLLGMKRKAGRLQRSAWHVPSPFGGRERSAASSRRQAHARWVCVQRAPRPGGLRHTTPLGCRAPRPRRPVRRTLRALGVGGEAPKVRGDSETAHAPQERSASCTTLAYVRRLWVLARSSIPCPLVV